MKPMGVGVEGACGDCGYVVGPAMLADGDLSGSRVPICGIEHDGMSLVAVHVVWGQADTCQFMCLLSCICTFGIFVSSRFDCE
jgi:hypothetical protein